MLANMLKKEIRRFHGWENNYLSGNLETTKKAGRQKLTVATEDTTETITGPGGGGGKDQEERRKT